MMMMIQIFAAFLVGGFFYMLAMIMTVYDGLLSLVLQPIVGTILTGGVIAGLLIIGLPIRLIKILNGWWRRHWWIDLVIGTLGLSMMVSSWMPHFRIKVLDPELQIPIDSFHPVLAVGGWLLTLFAVLHFYPPFYLLKWANVKQPSTGWRK